MDPSKDILSKGAKTRELLIRQSILLISKHGYNDVSFQMIADACEVSQGAPRYHFKTKVNLFIAIIDRIMDRKDGLVRNLEDISDDAFAKLLKFMRGNVTWALMFTAEAEVFCLLFYFAATDPIFADIYKKLVLRDLKLIEGALLSGQREKIFSFEESSSVISKILYDYMISQWISLLSGRSLQPKKVEIEAGLLLVLKKMVGYSGGGQPE